jgi:hypothetical protein
MLEIRIDLESIVAKVSNIRNVSTKNWSNHYRIVDRLQRGTLPHSTLRLRSHDWCPQNNARCEKLFRLCILQPCMRVLVRIRKCLGWLGLAMTSERMAIVRTYLLLRRIARDEDAMKYLMHEILGDWMAQRQRLRQPNVEL